LQSAIVNYLESSTNLGFRAIALNEGIQYLGSDTIPMYSTRDGMLEFLERNMNLLLDKKENVKDNLPHLISIL
jgi:hypothetical protein